MTVGNSAEVRLHNASLEHYRYTNLLSLAVSCQTTVIKTSSNVTLHSRAFIYFHLKTKFLKASSLHYNATLLVAHFHLFP
jgi:hypothetical protein